VASGETNTDGRIGDLLSPNATLTVGAYKMHFATAAYHQATAQAVFYPEVEIQFMVKDQSHYHIPLLLNPYGYSTYRGS